MINYSGLTPEPLPTYSQGGRAFVWNPAGQEIGSSAYDTRLLFAGADYVRQTGMYDMRNRFYQTGLNRFAQPDPIGFAGDATNLYRYCGNDPVNCTDASGLSGTPEKDDPKARPKSEVGNQSNNPLQRMTGLGGGDWIGNARGLSYNDINDLGAWGRDLNNTLAFGNNLAFRNPDGSTVLRADPQSNIIGVMGFGAPHCVGNPALIQLVIVRGGSTVDCFHLDITIGQLANRGYGGATLIGYSLGGVSIVDAASRFPSMQFNLIGIDPVRVGTRGNEPIQLPSNVVSATNYYQQNPHFWGNLGGNPFIGTPYASSTIAPQNYNFTGDPDFNHNNIVRKVADYIVGGQ